ncbi:MAG TPA: NADH-quinone oxidoreductase subunit M, partial [Blastocatellia bacterium]|nr:NADH-quinone oxidoreductase subunit M [Blastocatellia bacterium]
MNFTNSILTFLVFFPLLGALVVAFFGSALDENSDGVKKLAIGITVVEFLASLPLAFLFKADGGYHFLIKTPWIEAGGINANYHLGIDGVSIWLVILTTLICPIALLSSYKSITKRVRMYLVLMLMLETGMVGVFCALDMFLFYVFWEVMLIPMYFIIGVWGGERRVYAAIKFVLYTMVGSLLMLAGIISLYLMYGQATGTLSFDIPLITKAIQNGQLLIDPQTQLWIFLAFALAFLIKVPLFPFHTWLPDAHVEAPTAGSVILASVLLKMGTYGLIRFNVSMFYEASVRLAPVICLLAIIGIVYGALVAMVQPDIKKLVAYSSVSHLGFCVLGIFALTPMGMQGALYQMLAHGLSTGALFLLIGVIYDRRHTRQISEFGGLATPMPHYATVFMIATFASIGLPLLCGFVGEFLVLIGTFTSTTLPYAHWYTVIAATAMVWGAVYMLWMYQRV